MAGKGFLYAVIAPDAGPGLKINPRRGLPRCQRSIFQAAQVSLLRFLRQRQKRAII